jgi:hypothetical protein
MQGRQAHKHGDLQRIICCMNFHFLYSRFTYHFFEAQPTAHVVTGVKMLQLEVMERMVELADPFIDARIQYEFLQRLRNQNTQPPLSYVHQ